MAITKADVVAIAPELSAVADETVSAHIARTYQLLNLKAWGTRLDYAVALRVAHSLTVMGRGGKPPVTQEAVGPVSRSYAVSLASDASTFRSTSYGQEYEQLIKSTIGPTWRSSRG